MDRSPHDLGRTAPDEGALKRTGLAIAIATEFRFKKITAIVASALLAAGTSPAMAKAEGDVAEFAPETVQMSAGAVAPLDLSTPQSISGADQADEAEFKQLFASWKSMDRGTAAAPGMVPAPIASVSVPSRMPLDGSRLTSSYGMRNHPVTGGRRRHKGIDLAAPTGTPIYATADGQVSKAQSFSSYGLYVSIEHGGDLQTRYAHMSRIAVASGETVKKGDLIGYVGSTGRSTGPHLHYEVRVAGKAVNPLPYMAQSEAQTEAEGGRGGAE